jgi:hypothetical protein
VNGNLVSTSQYDSNDEYISPDDENFIPGNMDYRAGTSIAQSNKPLLVGAEVIMEGPSFHYERNLRKVSIDRVAIFNQELSDVEIKYVAQNIFSELSDGVLSATPYSLIGSKLYNPNEGAEVITEASADSEPALATKFWPPDAEYQSWESDTAGYMISELQKLGNENIPIYTSNEVEQLADEVDTLNRTITEQSNIIETQNEKIERLEEGIEDGTANNLQEYHGDCTGISQLNGDNTIGDSGYVCEDAVIESDIPIFAVCSDGANVTMYCPPDNNQDICVGVGEYPMGGIVTGIQACSGT